MALDLSAVYGFFTNSSLYKVTFFPLSGGKMLPGSLRDLVVDFVSESVSIFV